MEQDYLKLRWQKAIISEYGPEKTTRLILLVLSIFMDMNGICFPSTVSISKAAKVSLRSVITHLEKAEHDGWIKKMIAGFNGQGWKRNKYQAEIPEKVLTESQCDNDKVVQELHRLNEKGSATGAEGSATDDKKVVQELHSNIPIEHTKEHTKRSMPPTNDLFLNIPLKDGTEYSIFKNDINAWQESFPDVDVAQELRLLREWNLSNPAKQKTKRGIRKHITGWLTKEQKKDKYNGTTIQNTGKPTAEQRKYDNVPELVVEN